jgi:hypothetical protein
MPAVDKALAIALAKASTCVLMYDSYSMSLSHGRKGRVK